MVVATFENTATASGRPMDLHRQMTAYTMRVLGRLLLGSDLDTGIAEVAAAFPVINRHVRRRVLAPLRAPRDRPTPANRRAARARRSLDRVMDRIVRERRIAASPGADDLIGRLLATAIIIGADQLQSTPDPIPLAAGITLRPATIVPCTLRPIPTAHHPNPTRPG
jgi:cytochrome P450